MSKLAVIFGMVILLSSVFLAGGCTSPSSSPDLIGRIDSIQEPEGETNGRILVNSPGNNTSDKFMVTVTGDTLILKQPGEERQNEGFDAFNAGQKVEIWFSGPVMESYPAQVSAEKIVITEEPSSPAVPPLDDGVRGVIVEISCEDFSANPRITREIEITSPGSLVVSLCSNPSTGFEWEEVKIEDDTVIYQTDHNYVSPETTGSVGSSGKDVWSFNSGTAGTTTLMFEYSRPWEGGEQDEWTLALTVVVKK